MTIKDIPRLHRHNVRTLRRSPLTEISGALGDLGTLLPLMIALALQGSISLPSTLVFSGLFNMLTGIAFGIPLPVQPMKAIAAAAIASGATLRETLAAGALVGAAVGLLSVTGLLRWLTERIPVPVVKGIQFGAGMQLVISGGGQMLLRLGWVDRVLDNRIWALGAFLLLIATMRTPKRFPYALLVFLVGLVLAIIAVTVTVPHNDNTDDGDDHHYHMQEKKLPTFRIWHPFTILPGFAESRAWTMAVAQLPLTTLNSVIAAAALASELMGPSLRPQATAPPTVTELGVSVALMNLLGCWFGAMPVCHGAGGLAAQYRFGARSGASIVLLGACKLLLGLVLGNTLLDLLGSFPKALLGIMVIAAGLELAKVGQSLNYGASDLWEDSVSEGRDRDDGREDHEGGAGIPTMATTTSSSSSSTMRRRMMMMGAKRHRDISDEERQERWMVMLMTAAGILAFKNDAVGFLAGMFTHWAYAASHALERRYQRVNGERQPLLRWP